MPSDDELKARLLASMGLPGAKADSQLEAMKAIMAAKTKEDGSVWEPITEPEPGRTRTGRQRPNWPALPD